MEKNHIIYAVISVGKRNLENFTIEITVIFPANIPVIKVSFNSYVYTVIEPRPCKSNI